MSIDFKQLAKICVDAEMAHAISKASGEATIDLAASGNRMGSIHTHMITGPPGTPDLSGTPISYSAKYNATTVRVKCEDLRDFYANMGWVMDDFAQDNPRIIQ